MNIKLPKGRYILAVSGGLDSVVLLDLLVQKPRLELIVAHFNHGIRKNSHLDEKLVRQAAEKYNLPLEVGHGHLDSKTSEERARQKRYEFLMALKQKHKAKAIITAHHQDDLIETAFLNILRGTGRRGLSAIISNPEVVRPLLNVPKERIKRYVLEHNLQWNEDITNQDTKYLRNYIRRHVLPLLTDQKRRQILQDIDIVAKKRKELDTLIATLSHKIIQDNKISRRKFTLLPLEVGNEVLIYCLRQQAILQFTKPMVDKLNMTIRTGKPNTKHPVMKGTVLVVKERAAHFENS